MRLAIIGFGLVGGSIARALARPSHRPDGGPPGRWEIAAWSPTGRGPNAAAAEGAVALAANSLGDALDGAELVVLAAPPLACLELLGRIAALRPASTAAGAVVTDVASTKAAIVDRAAALGLRFVGGHPMAGRETSGYSAADGDLFVDRPWVIVPSGDEEAESRVEALAVACRARPLRLAADEHDRAVAAISHLPLIAAAALVEAVAGEGADDARDRETAMRLAASGWRDMTRLARGDVVMGAGIAATNAAGLAERLRAYRAAIDGWIVELERPGGPDPERLEARLREARRALESAAR